MSYPIIPSGGFSMVQGPALQPFCPQTFSWAPEATQIMYPAVATCQSRFSIEYLMRFIEAPSHEQWIIASALADILEDKGIAEYILYALIHSPGFRIRVSVIEQLKSNAHLNQTHNILYLELRIIDQTILLKSILRHEFRHAFWKALNMTEKKSFYTASTFFNLIFPSKPEDSRLGTVLLPNVKEVNAAIKEGLTFSQRIFDNTVLPEMKEPIQLMRSLIKQNKSKYARNYFQYFTKFPGDFKFNENPKKGDIKNFSSGEFQAKLTIAGKVGDRWQIQFDPSVFSAIFIIQYIVDGNKLYSDAESTYELEAALYQHLPPEIIRIIFKRLTTYTDSYFSKHAVEHLSDNIEEIALYGHLIDHEEVFSSDHFYSILSDARKLQSIEYISRNFFMNNPPKANIVEKGMHFLNGLIGRGSQYKHEAYLYRARMSQATKIPDYEISVSDYKKIFGDLIKKTKEISDKTLAYDGFAYLKAMLELVNRRHKNSILYKEQSREMIAWIEKSLKHAREHNLDTESNLQSREGMMLQYKKILSSM